MRELQKSARVVIGFISGHLMAQVLSSPQIPSSFKAHLVDAKLDYTAPMTEGVAAWVLWPIAAEKGDSATTADSELELLPMLADDGPMPSRSCVPTRLAALGRASAAARPIAARQGYVPACNSLLAKCPTVSPMK